MHLNALLLYINHVFLALAPSLQSKQEIKTNIINVI